MLTPPCNLTLYRSGERLVLFDAGSGPNFMPSAGRLPDSLDAAGIDPGAITDVAVLAIEGDIARLQVAECFLHCAKALMRSDFWQPASSPSTPTQPSAFLAASRFMTLATQAADGSADLSPKGDPAGALLKASEQHVCFADRPGNRRIDSFRNIVSQPRIALLAMIPGCLQVVEACGTAELSTSDNLRAAFRVREATPKLVTRMSVDSIALRHSPALARARLWPVVGAPAGLNGADIFKAHIQLNRSGGEAGDKVRAAIAVPGALEHGLSEDYKHNLY